MSRQWSSQPCAWTSTWWPAGHPMWCPCDLLFKRLRLLTLECVRAVDKPRKCTVYISSLCGSHSRSLVTRLGIRFRSFELQISFAALFLSSNSLKLEKAAEAFLHYIEGSKESKFFLMAISDGKFYISIISQHTTHCLKTEKEAIFKMHSGKTHKSLCHEHECLLWENPPSHCHVYVWIIKVSYKKHWWMTSQDTTNNLLPSNEIFPYTYMWYMGRIIMSNISICVV